MPVLNTLGNALMGVSAGLSIDGAIPAAMVGIPIDTARWLTDTLAIYQDDTGPGPAVRTYNTASHAISLIDSQGVTRMGAGGGKYAIFLQGSGVRSNIAGWVNPTGAATGDVSETGLVALNSSYGTGRGIALYDATGVLRFADPAVLLTPYNDPIPCRSGLVTYSTATGWLLRAAPTGDLIPCTLRAGLNYVVPVKLASGDIWLLERGNDLILRQKDATQGFKVNTTLSVNTFNPDAREISPGVVRVCWSTNAGEAHDALQAIDITHATGANRTAVVVASALVWTAQSPLTPVDVVTGAPTLTKWVGWYFSSGKYGDFRPRQNCTVLFLNFYRDGSGNVPAGSADQMRAAAAAAGGIFCQGSQEDIDVMRASWGLVAGLVTDEGAASDITTQAALFRANLAANGLPSKPIIATLRPGQLTTGWTAPSGVDAYAPEVYFTAPSVDYATQYAAATTLINSYVAAAGGVPLYLIMQAYDRNLDPAWQAAIPQITAIIDACGDALKADQ